MFTGIIQAQGKIERHEHRQGDVSLQIETSELNFSTIQLGDSIAVNGVCLTVVGKSNQRFIADVSSETLRLTTLGKLALGSFVNLETALTLNTLLGGHLVTGHVDGIGEILTIQDAGRSIRYDIKAPAEIMHYIAKKGSIAVDGTSLTVNEVNRESFSVNIVPHTQEKTLFKNYKLNTKVNLEVDIIARYLERLLTAQSPKSSKITAEFLKLHGFPST